MINPEMSELIAQSESEIATPQLQLAQIQERHDLLKAAEAMRDSILWQVDKALEMLNQVSPNQVAIFKAEINAKFETAEWRSEWDASKTGEIVLLEPKPTEAAALPKASAKTNSKPNKAFVAAFRGRVKEYRQFLIIQKEMEAIGIKVGKLIKSRDDAKGWNLSWNGNKAGLFWTVGNGWDVEALKSGDELTGQWEDFSLEQFLECNGIDVDPEEEELLAS